MRKGFRIIFVKAGTEPRQATPEEMKLSKSHYSYEFGYTRSMEHNEREDGPYELQEGESNFRDGEWWNGGSQVDVYYTYEHTLRSAIRSLRSHAWAYHGNQDAWLVNEEGDLLARACVAIVVDTYDDMVEHTKKETVHAKE